MNEQNRAGAGRFAAFLPAAAVYLALAFLMLITVYSSDDYWYSTFMDDGFAAYFDKMAYHYNEFNGRMLVHFVAQLILHCGNWLFALLGTALCLAVPCAASYSAGLEKRSWVSAALLFGVGVLAMSHTMLTRSLLWISAFCNYVLPTAMISGAVALMQCATRDRLHRWWMAPACLVCGFACGATTEQSGIIFILAALYYCAVCLFTNRGKLVYPLLCAATGALGVLTIFLSPATEKRFATETDTESAATLLDSLWDGFESQTELLGAGRPNAVLLVLLFAAVALTLWNTRRGKAPAILCLIPAALSLAASCFTGDVRTWLYLIIFICLVLYALALICAGKRVEALFVLLAVSSVCVMLPTNSSGERILLPFYLYCLAAAAVMLSRCLGRINPTLHVAGLYAAALAVLLLRIPLFAICWDNHEVEKLNQQYAEEARSTGVLYYCMDYDMEYTHSKAFSDDYFYEKYLESVGLYGVDGLQVYFYGEGRPEVYVGGQRMTSPAFPGDSGNWLLPLRDTVEYLGGAVEWVPGLTTVTLYGRAYSIHDDTSPEYTVTWLGSDGTEKSMKAARTMSYFQTCVDSSVFTDVFGLEVAVSEDGQRITIEP